MSWTDKVALETIDKLRVGFGIKHYIETGTFRAINAIVQANKFDYVWTCENHQEAVDICDFKLEHKYNIYFYQETSPKFLKFIKNKLEKEALTFIYLDAHFYDPNVPKDANPDKRFVVLEELKTLEDTKNCIIAIHDFDNGEFGHITYDDIKLNFDLVKKDIKKVNPDFVFYTNGKCDVYNEETIKELIDDKDAIDNIKYANTSPEKRDRGILYAIPKQFEFDPEVFNLRRVPEWN